MRKSKRTREESERERAAYLLRRPRHGKQANQNVKLLRIRKRNTFLRYTRMCVYVYKKPGYSVAMRFRDNGLLMGDTNEVAGRVTILGG